MTCKLTALIGPVVVNSNRRSSALLGLLAAACLVVAPAQAAARIPTLSKAGAEGHLADALHDHFGNGFNQAAYRRWGCHRMSRIRFRCHPRWGDRVLPTYGTATIWNSRESDGFYWNYSWRIHFPNGRVDVVT
jgi:hypothetical protein